MSDKVGNLWVVEHCLTFTESWLQKLGRVNEVSKRLDYQEEQRIVPHVPSSRFHSIFEAHYRGRHNYSTEPPLAGFVGYVPLTLDLAWPLVWCSCRGNKVRQKEGLGQTDRLDSNEQRCSLAPARWYAERQVGIVQENHPTSLTPHKGAPFRAWP